MRPPPVSEGTNVGGPEGETDDTTVGEGPALCLHMQREAAQTATLRHTSASAGRRAAARLARCQPSPSDHPLLDGPPTHGEQLPSSGAQQAGPTRACPSARARTCCARRTRRVALPARPPRLTAFATPREFPPAPPSACDDFTRTPPHAASRGGLTAYVIGGLP